MSRGVAPRMCLGARGDRSARRWRRRCFAVRLRHSGSQSHVSVPTPSFFSRRESQGVPRHHQTRSVRPTGTKFRVSCEAHNFVVSPFSQSEQMKRSRYFGKQYLFRSVLWYELEQFCRIPKPTQHKIQSCGCIWARLLNTRPMQASRSPGDR